MRVSLEKAIGKLAFKDRKETLVFYDSPWSNSHKFPWDYPPEAENLTILTTDSWTNPDFYTFLKNIGVTVYTTPALVHFKNGRIHAVCNGCGQINTHLNIYLGDKNERRNSSTVFRSNVKGTRKDRRGSKGSKGSNRGSRSKGRKEGSRPSKE